MKNQYFYFIITTLVLWSTNCFSQNEDTADETLNKSFKFAAKGGLNFSNNFGDVDDDESFLIDFHLGAVVTIPSPFSFNIQTEPQISRVGSVYNGKTAKRFTLLDIPILAQIYTVDEWSFEGGPKIAITVDQKQRNDFDEELQKVDRLKTITMGLVAGATYNFDDKLFGQFRINYSPSDVIRDEAGDNEGTSILLFQLSIGYWLN